MGGGTATPSPARRPVAWLRHPLCALPARLAAYRRVKELLGARPHNQGDAEWAAGVGAPDNGQRGSGAATMASD